MAPMVHGLEDQYSGRMNFAYLDVDDPPNDHFKEALGYRYQPHLFLVDEQGNILNQWVGFVSEEELIAAFEEVLTQ